MKELLIEAKLENLDRVLDFISDFIQDYPIKTQNQINIAIDEVFSNIARYAYPHDTDEATVRIEVEVKEEITITFEDNGIAYDPLAKQDPDTELSTEEREIGGLGIFLVKKLMDDVEYKRIGDKNILILKKA